MKKNEALKRAIKEEGRLQGWIADQLGINYTLLSHWVSGRRRVPDERKLELCRLLNRRLIELFPED